MKLDSAARYGIYQEDAQKDGYDECVGLFKRLHDQEQEMIRELVDHLQRRLQEAL